mgnify:CR=1 FL=1
MLIIKKMHAITYELFRFFSFFEDPNKATPISVGGGGTTGIGTGTTGYVHVVWNEGVYCSAGATVLVSRSTGADIVATAASVASLSTPESQTHARTCSSVSSLYGVNGVPP